MNSHQRARSARRRSTPRTMATTSTANNARTRKTKRRTATGNCGSETRRRRKCLAIANETRGRLKKTKSEKPFALDESEVRDSKNFGEQLELPLSPKERKKKP